MTYSCDYCCRFISNKSIQTDSIICTGDDGYESSYANPTYAHRVCFYKQKEKEDRERLERVRERNHSLLFFKEIINESIQEAQKSIEEGILSENECRFMRGAILGMQSSIEIMKRGSSSRMAEYIRDSIKVNER